MLDIAELIKRITDFINSKDEELSKKELKKAIGEIYDAMTKTEKKVRKSKKSSSESDDSSEKKKRAPTAYNLFMREQMAILKEQETADTDKMTAKAKMEFIANLWKQHKAATSDESDKEEPSVSKTDESPAKSTPSKTTSVKKETKKSEKKTVAKKDGRKKQSSDAEEDDE